MDWTKISRTAALATTLASVVFCASASEISIHKDSRTQYSVVIEGTIQPGDFEKIHHALKKSGPFTTRLYLFSPGGDVQESIKIAELVRTLKLETIIPMGKGEINQSLDTIEYSESCPSSLGRPAPRSAENCVCASACTILWVSGIERNFGLLRVHRPKFSDQTFATLNPDEAERAYSEMSANIDAVLSDYGFPEEGIQKMKSTPSYRAEKYRPFGVPTIVPYFDELLTARCSSSPDKGEFSLLRIKKRQNRASDEELARLSSLEATAGKVEECRVIQTTAIQWTSFSNYFGVDYEAKVRSGELYGD